MQMRLDTLVEEISGLLTTRDGDLLSGLEQLFSDHYWPAVLLAGGAVFLTFLFKIMKFAGRNAGKSPHKISVSDSVWDNIKEEEEEDARLAALEAELEHARAETARAEEALRRAEEETRLKEETERLQLKFEEEERIATRQREEEEEKEEEDRKRDEYASWAGMQAHGDLSPSEYAQRQAFMADLDYLGMVRRVDASLWQGQPSPYEDSMASRRKRREETMKASAMDWKQGRGRLIDMQAQDWHTQLDIQAAMNGNTPMQFNAENDSREAERRLSAMLGILTSMTDQGHDTIAIARAVVGEHPGAVPDESLIQTIEALKNFVSLQEEVVASAEDMVKAARFGSHNIVGSFNRQKEAAESQTSILWNLAREALDEGNALPAAERLKSEAKQMADQAAQEGNVQKRMAMMEEAAQLNVDAATLCSRVNMEEAMSHMNDAMKLAPRDPRVCSRFGDLCTDMGDISAAQEVYAYVLEIASEEEHGRLIANACMHLSEEMERQGERGPASAMRTRGIDIMEQLGLSGALSGEHLRAAESLRLLMEAHAQQQDGQTLTA